MPASASALTPSWVATSWSLPTAGSPGQTRQVEITGSEYTPTTSGRAVASATAARWSSGSSGTVPLTR